MTLNFDLKSFRENSLKMTQAEFAELLGLRQDNISRLEQSVEQIPLEILIKIADSTGTTLDELVKYKRQNPNPLDVENTWRSAEFTKRSIVNYIDARSEIFRSQWGEKYDNYFWELSGIVERVLTKPKIAIVGHSDVGKSRLINAIIGSEKMPTSWTPTTAITVHIKHVNDRPAFIEDEAWVFRASHNNEVGWDDKKLNDEGYCRAWKLSSGSAEILRDYGTRQGEMYGKNEAGTAVIFVESDILKNCDIIDLPGFGTGDRVEDDTMTLKAKEYADVLIFMSHAGQFMQGGGIEYLKESINSLNVVENIKENSLKPLSNLFIVASHAHTVDGGNPKSLFNILDNGCSRLLKTMPKGFWNNKESISGYKYDYNVLRSRFYTYTTDVEKLRKPFEDELKTLLETLPIIINEKAKVFIGDYVKSTSSSLEKEIDRYKSIIKDRDGYELLLKAIEKNEPKMKNENESRRLDIILDIKKMSRSSISLFREIYFKVINTDEIVKIIKEKGFTKKKEDIQSLVSLINSTLQVEMQEMLKSESENLKQKINKYIADFTNSLDFNKFVTDFPDIDFSFDATRAFASGLAGLATFGGLALWASTLGNLGAYILVAQGVSLLSALGISVGGTAAAVSTVAAMGGPVVLGVALAIIAAISIYALFSGGWEKSLAKKIVKEYDINNCLNKFEKCIDQFWLDTEVAFNAGDKKMKEDWKQSVNRLEGMISNYNVDELEHEIMMAETFINFLAGIPL